MDPPGGRAPKCKGAPDSAGKPGPFPRQLARPQEFSPLDAEPRFRTKMLGAWRCPMIPAYDSASRRCPASSRCRHSAGLIGAIQLHRSLCDGNQHPSEDQLVKRKCGIPVEAPRQSQRVENRGLPNGAARPLPFTDFKLEPGAAGDLHFRLKPQETVRLDGVGSPEVDRVSDFQPIWVSSSPSNPGPPNDQIEKAPQSP
jgi:hypothetical protein